MKYTYRIEKVKTNWGTEILTMNLPDEVSAAASFITNITEDFGEWYLEGFNLVLSGKEEYQERDGEFLGSQIKKDFTKIYDMFEGTHESCEIETIELKELIEIWLNELRNLNNK